MTRSVEILSHVVARVRSAVANKAAPVRERAHETADFGREWMMLSIASRVQPQNLPVRVRSRQHMKHGQNRRRPDSRAEQHDRAFSRPENEASARRADIERIAHPDMVPQVCSSRPIRLNLHADTITFCRGSIRKRVTAEKWRSAGGPLKTQDHVLAWQSPWQRFTVRALHRQREHVRGFVIYRRHRERAKSWRSRMRCCWQHEPRVPTSCSGRLALQ